MSILDGFSEPVELPNIPDQPGVAIVQDRRGQVLQVIESTKIRRRIGELLNTRQLAPNVHGAKVYGAQQKGTAILVRWKVTPDHKAEKKRLVQELDPLWKRQKD